jgi:hypothetical protein
MPPRVGGAGAGSDGAIGAGAGFGARFLAFALLAGLAFFIPFFLRAGAPRLAFLDFFATFNLPNRINQNYATRYHAVAAYLNLCTAVADCCTPTDLPDRTYQRQFET